MNLMWLQTLCKINHKKLKCVVFPFVSKKMYGYSLLLSLWHCFRHQAKIRIAILTAIWSYSPTWNITSQNTNYKHGKLV